MGRNEALACREVTALLIELSDGLLAAGQHSAVEAHLLRCGNCARYLEQLRETMTRTRALGTQPPHRELDVDRLLEDLLRHLRTDRDGG